jgi:hypothetical protein
MYELYESSSTYVWSFLVYTGRGMELMNQSLAAEINKIADHEALYVLTGKMFLL